TMNWLADRIASDQQDAAEKNRRAFHCISDSMTLIPGCTPSRQWRLLAAIEERLNFWRDKRHENRYGIKSQALTPLDPVPDNDPFSPINTSGRIPHEEEA